MADNDDFRLEDEGEDLFAEVGKASQETDRSRILKQEREIRDTLHHFAGQEDGDSAESPPEADPEPSLPSGLRHGGAGSSSSTRTVLLLVLLLALAGGAGYYFFILSPEPTRPQRAPAPKQAITIPPRPEPAAPVTNQEPPAKPAVPATTETPPAPPAAAAPPAPVPKPEPEVKTVEIGQKEVVAPAEPAPRKVPAAAAQSSNGPFFLETAAFLNQAGSRAAEAKIREMGFQPEARTDKKPVTMTRLLLGLFPPAQGEARLNELKKLADGAFVMRREGKLAVFAGSFSSPENAREAAADLSRAGVRVTEEPASVELAATVIRFGHFANREEAEKSAVKARGAGLEVKVARSE